MSTGRAASAAVAPQSATVVLAAPDGCTAGHPPRPLARFDLELLAAAGARLVWTPRPTVLVPGANLRSSVVVRAEPGARVLVGDAFVQHRPVGRPGGVERAFGLLDASVTVEIGGQLVAADRQRTTGEWPVAAHGFVWAVGWGVDGPDVVVARLLDAGLAAGELPNGAGVGVRAAGRAGEVTDALARAIAILRGDGRDGVRASGLTS